MRDFGGPDRPDFLCTVMLRFLTESDELVDRLSRALNEQDVAALRVASHTLKSTSAIVGASALAACCATTEIAARGGRSDEAMALGKEILTRLERIKPVIRMQAEAVGDVANIKETAS